MLTSVLRANAASCLVFGLLFLVLPGAVAGFLGAVPAPVVLGVGAVLLINGFHLLWASFRPALKWEILYFSAGDSLWVAATIVLVAGNIWITTGAGEIAAVLVALMVGTFGGLQFKAFRGLS